MIALQARQSLQYLGKDRACHVAFDPSETART